MSAPAPPPPLPAKTKNIQIGNDGKIYHCAISGSSARRKEDFISALNSAAESLGINVAK